MPSLITYFSATFITFLSSLTSVSAEVKTQVFACVSENGSYITRAINAPWGDVDIIQWATPSFYEGIYWGWDPKRRCDKVANILTKHFSDASLEQGFTVGTVSLNEQKNKQGKVITPAKDYPIICVGTDPCQLYRGGSQSRLFFMLEPNEKEYGDCVIKLLEELRFTLQKGPIGSAKLNQICSN